MDQQHERFIDQQVVASQNFLRSRFAWVTKSRAHTWVTVAVALFILELL